MQEEWLVSQIKHTRVTPHNTNPESSISCCSAMFIPSLTTQFVIFIPYMSCWSISITMISLSPILTVSATSSRPLRKIFIVHDGIEAVAKSGVVEASGLFCIRNEALSWEGYSLAGSSLAIIELKSIEHSPHVEVCVCNRPLSGLILAPDVVALALVCHEPHVRLNYNGVEIFNSVIGLSKQGAA